MALIASSAVVLADALLADFFYGCARRCSGFFTMPNDCESREWSPKLQGTDRLCKTLDRLLKSHEGLVCLYRHQIRYRGSVTFTPSLGNSGFFA